MGPGATPAGWRGRQRSSQRGAAQGRPQSRAGSAGMPAIRPWGSCPQHARGATRPSELGQATHRRGSFPPSGLRPPGTLGELLTLRAGCREQPAPQQDHGERETEFPSVLWGGQASLPARQQPSHQAPGRHRPPTNPRATAMGPEPSCQQHPTASSLPGMPQCSPRYGVCVPQPRGSSEGVPATPPHPAGASPALAAPGGSRVGSPSAAQRRLSPLGGNVQLSARRGQRDFTGTSRPPPPAFPLPVTVAPDLGAQQQTNTQRQIPGTGPEHSWGRPRSSGLRLHPSSPWLPPPAPRAAGELGGS